MAKTDMDIWADDKGSLYLVPGKGNKNWLIWFILGVPSLCFGVSYLVLKNVKMYWQWDLLHIVILVMFAAITGLSYFNKLIKMLTNSRGCMLRKQAGNIIMNKRVLCHERDLLFVIIQPVYGSSPGYRLSYSIGLGWKNKSIAFSFYNHGKEAKRIADETSIFFGIPVKTRKPYLYSFFRKF